MGDLGKIRINDDELVKIMKKRKSSAKNDWPTKSMIVLDANGGWKDGDSEGARERARGRSPDVVVIDSEIGSKVRDMQKHTLAEVSI